MGRFLALAVMCAVLVVSTTGLGDHSFRFPSRKAWWAKQVTADVYTAGRLTRSQLKMAAEAGFRSIVSMFNHTRRGRLGDEVFPTTDESKDIVTRLAGIEFGVVIPETGYKWQNLETVRRFGKLYDQLPKPLLFHCFIAYSVTYTTLLHFANVTRHKPEATPNIDKRELYRRAAALGYDFTTSSILTDMISHVTGQDDHAVPPTKPEVSLPDWNTHAWIMKPAYRNWYVAGAVQTNHVTMLNQSGMQTIINNRRAGTGYSRPEEVILLNIKDRTGPGRQQEEELQNHRLDPNKPSEYISPGSEVNYQSRNPRQFGDHVGYNETRERLYIQQRWPIQYIHSPIGGQYGFSLAMWNAYRAQWLEQGRDRHVLVHCRTGYRSAVVALLSAGYVYCKSSSWALDRAAGMGYHFEAGTEDDVINLFREVLDNNPTTCVEPRSDSVLGSSAHAPSMVCVGILVCMFMSILHVH